MADIVTDAKGRKITLRKLTIVEQVRLLRAMGPVQASNEPYSQVVNMAAMVSDIDGIPVPFPINEVQIDAAIKVIGDEGFSALIVRMRSEIDDAMAAAEAAAAGGEKPDPLEHSA